MRKVTLMQAGIFSILFGIVLALGLITTGWLLGGVALGDFRGVILVVAGAGFVYLYAFAIFRLFQAVTPLQPGEIKPGSRQESVYHIYLLFFLVLFYPIMRSGAVPVPLMRLVYLALGARLGKNTYSTGVIFDPRFVEIGDNTLLGQYAMIIPHVIENERLAHYPVRIGSNVTIGAQAVVLTGVVIGDGALVATGAVVAKGTRIGAGEVWGGIPARCLRRRAHDQYRPELATAKANKKGGADDGPSSFGSSRSG